MCENPNNEHGFDPNVPEPTTPQVPKGPPKSDANDDQDTTGFGE